MEGSRRSPLGAPLSDTRPDSPTKHGEKSKRGQVLINLIRMDNEREGVSIPLLAF